MGNIIRFAWNEHDQLLICTYYTIKLNNISYHFLLLHTVFFFVNKCIRMLRPLNLNLQEMILVLLLL